MSRRIFPPADLKPFAQLEVKMLAGATGTHTLAVHVSGRLDDARTPLVCIADYCRNMTDFQKFLNLFHHDLASDWPVILLDLAGHGRSLSRKQSADYSTTNDARDVGAICTALGIERAVFMGQGYGGQVIMALAGQQCHLIAGSILIDAAPMVHAPGIVRMRDNLELLVQMRDEKQFDRIAHQAYGKSYPGITDEELDEIISRTFMRSKSGRIRPFFDFRLVKKLAHISYDDLFEPQWSLFNMLSHGPLMLVRTQLTDQLSRTIFEHMARLRSDSLEMVVPGQGSPALLQGGDEVGAIVDFVKHASKRADCEPIVCG